jgi:cytochrome P450
MYAATDLLSEQARINPYPIYAELREQNDGVHYLAPLDFWVALRYDDVLRLNRERKTWSSDLFVEGQGFGTYDKNDPVHLRYAEVASRNLMINDAPDHTRLRGLLNHAFAGKATKLWDPAIQAVVDEVLDAIEPDTELDFMADVAEVVPVWVISNLLGVPIADRERFRRLSVAFTETFDPTVMGERRDRAIRESVELFDYVKALAQDRGRAAGDDLLTTLIDAEEGGAKLTMDELIACTCMLLVAGNETTADLIGTGIVMFMDHPDQFAALRGEPDLIPNALLEVLRYESPLQFSPRIVAEDVRLGSAELTKGDKVFFSHGSANRDPRVFDDPETFDIRRGDKRHLAFAAGPHFCIGNQLALREGELFFRSLLDRFGAITPTKPAQKRTDRFFQYGFASVPVHLAAK